MEEQNNLKKIREERMMSKAELSRRARLSVLTIARVEQGHRCRMKTKRRILDALDIALEDRKQVWPDS